MLVLIVIPVIVSKDYLSHRQCRKCVTVGNDRFMFLPLSKGDPQGLILGSVLFIIYKLERPSSC